MSCNHIDGRAYTVWASPRSEAKATFRMVKSVAERRCTWALHVKGVRPVNDCDN
jgi:hypothetical protein